MKLLIASVALLVTTACADGNPLSSGRQPIAPLVPLASALPKLVDPSIIVWSGEGPGAADIIVWGGPESQNIVWTEGSGR